MFWGNGRLQRMGKGPVIFANVRVVPSQVKAEVVYSADWRPCFFLKVGYFALPSKKFVNAHVLRDAGEALAARRRPHSARTSLFAA